MALVLALAALTGMAGCRGRRGSAGGEQVTIAVSPQPASAPVYLAFAKGFFAQEGLRVKLTSYTAGKDGLRAVVAGQADFCTVADTPLMLAALRREPIAIVSTIAISEQYMSIVARKDRGLTSAAKLVGRRVGLVRGSNAEFYLHVYLVTSHIDPGQVHVVGLAPDQVVPALLEGRVDAVCTWSPHSTNLESRLGANAAVSSDPSIYTMTWNIAARQDAVRRDPGRVERLLRGLRRAETYVADHPDEARLLTSRYLAVSPPLSEREWSRYNFGLSLDQSLLLSLEDQARWQLQTAPSATSGMPDFLDLISTTGLKAVQPEAVRIPGR